MLLQTFDNSYNGPAQNRGGLKGHEPVGDLAKDVRGSESKDFCTPRAVQKLSACRTKDGVGSKVVNKRVRIQENRIAGREIGKRHGASCGSSSGSRAKNSTVAGSPFHPSRP